MMSETAERIDCWESEIDRFQRLITECTENGDETYDNEMELYIAKCSLSQAWQDDELEEMSLR